MLRELSIIVAIALIVCGSILVNKNQGKDANSVKYKKGGSGIIVFGILILAIAGTMTVNKYYKIHNMDDSSVISEVELQNM